MYKYVLNNIVYDLHYISCTLQVLHDVCGPFTLYISMYQTNIQVCGWLLQNK